MTGEARSASARPQSKKQVRIRARKPGLLLFFAAVVVFTLTAGMFGCRAPMSSNTADAAGDPPEGTVAVERKEFRRTLRLHGTVEAVRSQAVSAPMLGGPGGGSLIITRLAPKGVMVHAGDILVEFDPQNQMKTVLDRQAEYQDLLQQIKKRIADQKAAEARDRTEIVQAENNARAARVEMRRNEVLSRIDAEKNAQSLEEAEAELAQLRETFELKRKAAQAALRILEIQRDRAHGAMLHARENIEKMTIRSPIAGLVVPASTWKGNGMGDVQEGEEMRPGAPVANVVDASVMQVRAQVNQADIACLQTGQRIEVRLDAYPELLFQGTVGQIAAIGTEGSFSDKVRRFTVLFPIEGNDPKLLPDLSAAVDVILERRKGVLVLPRAAVMEGESGPSVLVSRPDGFRERPVKLSGMNDLEVVIESGLEEGTLVLRRPEDGAGEDRAHE